MPDAAVADSEARVARLRGHGVWSWALRYGDPGAAADRAAELESLGYTAVWLPDIGGDLLADARRLLAATDRLIVASGVLNLWMHPAEALARDVERLHRDRGDRFLLGIGVSHRSIVDARADSAYGRPMERMTEYLDALDGGGVPSGSRVLAALGPRMLGLAGVRAAGAHTYLVTPEHTRQARAILGTALLAPVVAVVLERDPTVAREAARRHLSRPMTLPNYRASWRRQGFTADDVAAGGSDRLVDALVAWGDDTAISRRIQEHVDAGADHVAIQVVTENHNQPTPEHWRRIASAMEMRTP